MVGYRYFDTYQIAPQFEFGYGLSYTSFEYSDLKMNPIWKDPDKEFDVSFSITNTGKRYGQEIAQLYIHQQQCSVKRPVKELKDFCKVTLQPGEETEVIFKITEEELRFLTENERVESENGVFEVFIGSDSTTENKAEFVLKK